MSNQTGMISACEAPQMMRDAQRMQRDLERIQRQLQQLRRQLLLASIEHCSSRDTVHELWQKLKPEEQQDDEIVYTFLSSPCLPPYRRIGNEFNMPNLPDKFLSDPKAVLAFLSTTLWWTFEVPRSVRDNKEVMMAVCANCPRVFDQASKRLQDDVDLCRTALPSRKTRVTETFIMFPNDFVQTRICYSMQLQLDIVRHLLHGHG